MARRGTPLPESLVQEIKNQLADGKSQRSIARDLQVSRTTISAIAHDTRVIVRPAAEDEDDGPLRQEIYPPQRCPGCCAMLNVLPCLSCQLRGNLKGVMLRDAYPNRKLPEEIEALHRKSA